MEVCFLLTLFAGGGGGGAGGRGERNACNHIDVLTLWCDISVVLGRNEADPLSNTCGGDGSSGSGGCCSSKTLNRTAIGK